MIDLSPLKDIYGDRPVAIFGLGISGMASVKAFCAAGFHVIVMDDNPDRLEHAKTLGAIPHDLIANMPKDTACLVLAPGVPLTHPEPHAVVKSALNKNIEIVSDIEILHRATPHIKKIGITGTNGKSTTTALIGHCLASNKFEFDMGGNLGKPALAFNPVSNDGFYVIEMSSYQLDLCPTFKPDISILLNISPDHLDRHGGMDGYIKSKSKIFDLNSKCILGIDDEYTKRLSKKLHDQNFSLETLSLVENSADIVMQDDRIQGEVSLKNCHALQGTHNHQNAMAAFSACRALGISNKNIQSAFECFPGLAHRQNIICDIGQITFINDSKATNDEAAAKALSTFQNIYWIAGGKAKGTEYPKCKTYFSHLKHSFLIGEGAKDLGTYLDENGQTYTQSETLDRAITQAFEKAKSDLENGIVTKAVILLSPACASFDQFLNFEVRGDVFTHHVHALKGHS